MRYGIYITKENYDILEDGNEKKVAHAQGWYKDSFYRDMKTAKKALEVAKEYLNEEGYNVSVVNSVTINGERKVSYKAGIPKSITRITYHIEKR